MSNTIKLTKEEYEALPQSIKDAIRYGGSTVNIDPPKPKKWEPEGVQKGEMYHYVSFDGDVEAKINDKGDLLDEAARDFGNMFVESWQAKEALKQTRATNRIRQYVLGHMAEGEDRDCSVLKNDGCWEIFFVARGCYYPGDFLMPKRVAEMLVEDLNSGRVEL